MTMSSNPLYNFISPVTGKLAGIFQFPDLQQDYIWIGDINNRPVATDLSDIFPLFSLTKGMLWTGNSDNNPVETQVIKLNNLPLLYDTEILGLELPAGQIYRGTSSGIPEESDALSLVEADLLTFTAWRSTSRFIINSGTLPTRELMPYAQFLSDLGAGITQVNASGILSLATSDNILDSINLLENYIFVGNAQNHPVAIRRLPAVDNLPLLAENNLWIGSGGGIPQVRPNLELINLPNLAKDYFWVGDANSRPAEVNQLKLINLPNLPANNIWAGSADNTTYAIDTLNSTFVVMSGRAELPNAVSLGGLNNGLLAKDNESIINATLTNGKFWKGDANNKPVEIDLNFAPNDASYILKTSKIGLNNAQALSELIGGILKSAPLTGTLSSAIGGVDYATEASVVAAQAAAEAAAVEAAAAPAAGALLAAIYFNAQMLPYSLLPLIPAGISISGAIAAAAAIGTSAAVSASSAQSTADTAITRIDNLNVTLKGDVTGSGNLSDPIITNFIENPSFLGHEYIKIPTGNNAQRPSNPSVGMLRYNTEL